MKATIFESKKMDSKNVTIETVAKKIVELVVTMKGDDLKELKAIRTEKGIANASLDNAKERQEKLLAKYGLEPVDFLRNVRILDGNSNPVAKYPTNLICPKPKPNPEPYYKSALYVQKIK